MEVIWTEEAEKMYFRIADYLLTEWDLSVALRFESSVNNLITKLQSFNELCPQSKVLLCHKCTIDGHNSLVYKIINDTIFIVTLLDNRSIHSY
jgi:plasmid stabilization system protein ParE